jgi:cullin 3
VRVMKAKKRLDHNSIVMEVTAQVRNRFMPTPADIKKHIETLIEREYIERDPSDRKMYVYLA